MPCATVIHQETQVLGGRGVPGTQRTAAKTLLKNTQGCYTYGNWTYRSTARNVLWIGLCPLQERFHLFAGVVASVVVRPHNTIDDFGVVVELTHHF